MGARAIAYGEERSIRFSRPVCSEQVSASETLPILPGWNNPALELLICDCPGGAQAARDNACPLCYRAHELGCQVGGRGQIRPAPPAAHAQRGLGSRLLCTKPAGYPEACAGSTNTACKRQRCAHRVHSRRPAALACL